MSQSISKTVIKTGNSLAVVIPSRFVKKIGLKQGDEVKINFDPLNATISYSFPNVRQLSLMK